MHPDQSYGRQADKELEDEYNDALLPSQTMRRHKSRNQTLLVVISYVVVFMFGAITSGILSQFSSSGTWRPSRGATDADARAKTSKIIDGVEVPGTQCGTDWREAKAMGCQFDVMASRWYAPECFDQAVLHDMLAEPQVNWNFTWYEDKSQTIVVPPEKVLKGEFDKVYPDNLFHIKHCLHLWRKLHHAVVNNTPIDEEILDYHHTVHCTRMIMDWMDPGFKRHSVTSAKSGTPFCRSSPLGLLNTGR